jgi:uncharacterized protein YktA (UPF0223 family)
MDNNLNPQINSHIFIIIMTREELENNYEYKVTKKALMREFPFIKDVFVKEDEEINKWSFGIFLDLIIDPFAFGHQYGFRVWGPVINYLKRGESYMSPYLSLFIGDSNRIDLATPVNRAMEELMDGIHTSPAIPYDFKLDKKLMLGSYTALPSSVPSNMTD